MTTAASPIVRVSWRPFRVPFAAAAQTSRAALGVREGFIITVETADGLVGVGESSPLPDFEGGVLGEVAAALDGLAHGLLGARPADLWGAQFAFDTVSEPSQRVTRAGIETALADLLSRRSGQPMWAWLAEQTGIAVHRPVEIPANALVDAETPDDMEAAVLAAARDGYRTIKLKVGRNLPDDIDRVRAARRGNSDVELRVDANGAWDEATALEALRRFEPFRVALCEQPLDPRRPDVFEATARLRSQVGVPIALDESCRTPENVRDAVASTASDAVVIKPMFTGLQAAIEMIHTSRAAGLRTIVTTTFDTGIGTAMAAHVAALLPNPRSACGLATLSRLEHSLVHGAALVERPVVCPPGGPGLGVALDREAISRYAGGAEHQVAA